MKFALLLVAAACVLLLAGCALQRVVPTETAVVRHGPFEIVATGRRISSGGFPNTSGNPFATREVTSFTVRWRGKEVEVPQVGTRFWRALRLPGAPEPALLVSTTDVHLISEHEGRLVVRSFGPKTTGLTQMQWLDSQAGQPGGANSYGIAHLDATTGTELAGGRWLRLGDHTVLDVQTLKAHPVQPWVRSGQPLAGMNGSVSVARAFSPGRTQYAMVASQYDSTGNGGRIDALVVVDLHGGETYAVRLDKGTMRYADHDDIHSAWVDHHFEWVRDAAGRERLQVRKGAKAMPWRGRFVDFGDFIEYRVQPVRPAMNEVLKRFVVERLGGKVVGDPANPNVNGLDTFELPGCGHVVAISFHDEHTGVYVPMAKRPPWRPCQDTVRQIGTAFDAELASGRWDGMFIGVK